MRHTKRIHRLVSPFYLHHLRVAIATFFLSFSSCFLFFLIPTTMTVAADGARCRNESSVVDTDKGTVISLVRSVISFLSFQGMYKISYARQNAELSRTNFFSFFLFFFCLHSLRRRCLPSFFRVRILAPITRLDTQLISYDFPTGIIASFLFLSLSFSPLSPSLFSFYLYNII